MSLCQVSNQDENVQKTYSCEDFMNDFSDSEVEAETEVFVPEFVPNSQEQQNENIIDDHMEIEQNVSLIESTEETQNDTIIEITNAPDDKGDVQDKILEHIRLEQIKKMNESQENETIIQNNVFDSFNMGQQIQTNEFVCFGSFGEYMCQHEPYIQEKAKEVDMKVLHHIKKNKKNKEESKPRKNKKIIRPRIVSNCDTMSLLKRKFVMKEIVTNIQEEKESYHVPFDDSSFGMFYD